MTPNHIWIFCILLLPSFGQAAFFGLDNASPEEEPLIQAAEKGDTTQVAELIQKRVDVNCKQGLPLLKAVLHNHLDIIQLLLQAGASISHKEVTEAVQQEKIPVLLLLIQHNADIHFEKENPLVTAAFNDSFEAITILLKNGSQARDAYNKVASNTNPNFATARRILHYLAYPVEHIKELQKDLHQSIYPKICFPSDTFSSKARSWLAVIPSILPSDSLKDHSRCSHKTDLMIVCALGYDNAVKAILICKVPQSYLYAQDNKGYTAIMYAAKYNRESIATLLTNYEATLEEVQRDCTNDKALKVYQEAEQEARKYNNASLAQKLSNFLSTGTFA